MSEWKQCRLGDVCSFKNGRKRQNTIGKTPIYGGNGVLGYSNDYNNSNCNIIGRVGAYCGCVYHESGNCWVSDNAIVSYPINNNDIKFCYFLLSNLQLNKRCIGSGQPLLTQEILNNIPISIPSLPTQRKIASILSALDDKIELNNRMNKNLEEQARAIFKSWFVDFEPWGGVMPSDWITTTIGKVCKCQLGGTPSRNVPEYWNGNIPWINSGEVNKFRIIQPTEYITNLGVKESSTKLLPSKTTVIAITGATLGKVSLLEISSCANQSVVGIIPNQRVPFTYIYPFIKHAISDITTHQTGGAQQHINKQNIESTKVIIPNDMTIMNQFNNNVNTIYNTISSLCFESRHLAALRDTLLPKLMSGELDVSDINL